MSWLWGGGGNSSSQADASSSTNQSEHLTAASATGFSSATGDGAASQWREVKPMTMAPDFASTIGGGGGGGGGGFGAAAPEQQSAGPLAYENRPVLSLDDLKHAGVSLNRQMSPYLQMDPSMFVQAQPQYIFPEAGQTGKGKFEFALSQIGAAVGGGFFFGAARGFLPELFNPDTKQLSGKPWATRIVNATVKHGSGWAQPVGTAVFLYSLIEVGLGFARSTEDEANGLAAGALAGAIYRSTAGLRASAVGAAVGGAVATVWTLANEDKRTRLLDMVR